jgi:predicted dehydrogenase
MKDGRLGMGLVGPGFVARHHIDAARRLGDVDVIGLAGSSPESAARKATDFKVARVYADYRELVNDPAVDVVHNTTPNYVHAPVILAALRAGKHIISDKPLGMTIDECMQLTEAAAEANVVNAVTFNYRGNPLVQEARLRMAAGELGDLVYIHGHYLQDWMTNENVYSWRMDPERGGASSALADIGSHWCDLAEHMTGLRIVSVLADMGTVVTPRYSAGASAEAFGRDRRGEHHAVAIHGEDLATVLLRFDNGARGSLKVAQVLPGHKNDLQIEVNGREGSLRWEQERQNELWFGRHHAANVVLMKDPTLLSEQAARYACLPGGHQEGWADALRNVMADIYDCIRDGRNVRKAPTVCSFAEATRIACIIDAMLRSAADGGVWKDVTVPGSLSKMQEHALHSAGTPAGRVTR